MTPQILCGFAGWSHGGSSRRLEALEQMAERFDVAEIRPLLSRDAEAGALHIVGKAYVPQSFISVHCEASSAFHARPRTGSGECAGIQARSAPVGECQ